MKRNELFKLNDEIIRILREKDNQMLVMDCIKITMPVWKAQEEYNNYSIIDEQELYDYYEVCFEDMDEVDAERKKVMYHRYTLIAGVIPFIGDIKQRNSSIDMAASEYEVSKQSIRKYLCRYLAFNDIRILLPKKRNLQKELSQDEKNMRWSLNKFFYNYRKNTLKTAYTLMLKEKYCDADGILLDDYPSFYQYRYFYRKTRKLQNYYISRNGLTNYQRNNRPCIGDGVQQYAPSIGTGMVDASQVCINHIGLLIIDEIQHVYGHRNGITLINMITQLINTSGVSICMVGTEESIAFFEKAPQLARRALGLKYGVLGYDDYFRNFCKLTIKAFAIYKSTAEC